MNMSMDKPIALSSTVGTRGPQMKNAKIEVPRPGAVGGWRRWIFEKHQIL